MKNLKKISIIILLFIGVSLFLVACKKEHSHSEAELNVTKPTTGQEFMNGDTVHIEGKLTAEEEMHGWVLAIRKIPGYEVVFMDDQHDHLKEYNIKTFWVNNLTSHTNLELEVIGYVNHDGDSISKKVSFHAHM